MIKLIPDPRRAVQWTTLKARMKSSAGAERQRLLQESGSEIAALTQMAARASSEEWDMDASMEFAGALGALAGGWLKADPYNTSWPGRDRLVVAGTDNLIAVCAALASIGFFSAEHVARIADQACASPLEQIPGLESMETDATLIPAAAWAMAVESRKSKIAWREHFNVGEYLDWADDDWLQSPAMWRTCLITRAGTAAAHRCRELPNAAAGTGSGFVAVVTAPADESVRVADVWRDDGWEAFVVAHNDLLGFYECLSRPASDQPVAVILSITSLTPPKSGRQNGEATLLGQMTDEQFNAVMDEYFTI